MSLCDKLNAAKKDEEGGVAEYLELKKEISPEHQDYISAVENIISDERSHLNKVTEMIKTYNCLEEEKIKRRKRK